MKDVLTFASGSNAGQEIMGFADIQMAPGVTVPDFRANTIPTLEGDFLSTPYPLFLDSGAVAEVEFQNDGPPVVVDPISHEEWIRRLGVYKHLASLYGTRLYAVAPDRVGSQEETLERLIQYRDQVRELIDLGANVIFAAQPGDLDRHQFLQQCLDAVGVDLDQVVVGFPMRRGVTTLNDIELFLDHMTPSKIHLLGMGTHNNQFGATIALIQKNSPDSMISNDAVLFRGAVGFGITNGQKDRSKAKGFTASQINAGEWLAGTLFAEPPPVDLFGDQIRGDYTDIIVEPSLWMKPTWIKDEFPKEAMLTSQEARSWRQDPDSFLQAEDPNCGLPYYELPMVEIALNNFWVKHHEAVTCQQKKRMAIVEFFGSGSDRWAPVPDSYIHRNPNQEGTQRMEIVVITSCTGQKAVKSEHQITLEEFRQGVSLPPEREAELADLMTPAEKMYTGQQHKRLMRGVEAIREGRTDIKVRLFILSAGYGLIPGEQEIAPYEATFQGMTARERKEWAEALGIPQAVRDVLRRPYDMGFVLLGDDYLKACGLSNDVTLGGDTVAFCSPRNASKLEAIGMTAVPLANPEAKKFSCGIISLKGELTARLLEQVAQAPEKEIGSMDEFLSALDEETASPTPRMV